MPRPGHYWWHIVLNTHGSWLHGDPRGFRSRAHRIHSSGDYKHKPPEGEHAGLHAYQKSRCPEAVKMPPELLETVGLAIVKKIGKQKHHLLAVSVDATHAHVLVELPAKNHAEVNTIAATWKQATSHAVRERLPGRVWSAGGSPTQIEDQSHQDATYHYILRHEKEGAWTWSFRLDAKK